MGTTKDFFISYTGTDRQWAEWIAWQLSQNGYDVLIQAWDFRPGTNFIEQMNIALADSKLTIAVLSSAYLKSSYGRAEWTANSPPWTALVTTSLSVEGCDPARATACSGGES